MIEDPVDNRDYLYIPDFTDQLPTAVSLRQYCGQVEEQGNIGACVANAAASACEMYLIANAAFSDTPDTDSQDLSRLFLYYNAREATGAIGKDGSSARECLRSLRNQGVCYERTYPYDTSKVDIKPPQEAYDEALTMKADGYYRIKDNILYSIRHAIASGYPVLVALPINSNFQPLGKDEILPLVDMTKLVGCHEVLCVGYDGDSLLFENSWNTWFSDSGFFRASNANTAIFGDVWVLQGFAGYARVGVNLVVKTAKPVELSLWQKIVKWFKSIFKK